MDLLENLIPEESAEGKLGSLFSLAAMIAAPELAPLINPGSAKMVDSLFGAANVLLDGNGGGTIEIAKSLGQTLGDLF
ncbi:MAG: hypothetical protein K2X27_25520 [Candidatus Obscuribacterales bacterium]|nr:hypothetical protein [Candidatus Obscuribacterales bacterium]